MDVLDTLPMSGGQGVDEFKSRDPLAPDIGSAVHGRPQTSNFP